MAASRWRLVFLGGFQGGLGVLQRGLGVLHDVLGHQTWRPDKMAALHWVLCSWGSSRVGWRSSIMDWGSSRVGWRSSRVGWGSSKVGNRPQSWRRDDMAASRWRLVFLGVLQGGLEVLRGLEVLQGGLGVLQGGLGSSDYGSGIRRTSPSGPANALLPVSVRQNGGPRQIPGMKTAAPC